MTKVYIQTGVGRRLIGEVDGGIFTTRRQSSKHLYNKLNAWGIDCKAYDGMLKDKELHTIRVIDLDTETTYSTHAENFKKYGTILHFKPHRTQVFLPLKYWSEETKNFVPKGGALDGTETGNH